MDEALIDRIYEMAVLPDLWCFSTIDLVVSSGFGAQHLQRAHALVSLKRVSASAMNTLPKAGRSTPTAWIGC
jgi:hypothetical protein